MIGAPRVPLRGTERPTHAPHHRPSRDGGDGLIAEVYAGLFSGTTSLIALAYYSLVVIVMWKAFTKAGYPVILALIPIVNLIFLIKIADMSGVARAALPHPDREHRVRDHRGVKLGARFGKGGAFSFFLLWFLPFIGYFIVGFGQAQYRRA